MRRGIAPAGAHPRRSPARRSPAAAAGVPARDARGRRVLSWWADNVPAAVEGGFQDPPSRRATPAAPTALAQTCARADQRPRASRPPGRDDGGRMDLTQAARDALTPLGYEVLEVSVGPHGRSRRVLVRIDRLDEQVVGVEDVRRASEAFGLELDRLDPFEGAYQLEVRVARRAAAALHRPPLRAVPRPAGQAPHGRVPAQRPGSCRRGRRRRVRNRRGGTATAVAPRRDRAGQPRGVARHAALRHHPRRQAGPSGTARRGPPRPEVRRGARRRRAATIRRAAITQPRTGPE
jgi:hypothetical protein